MRLVYRLEKYDRENYPTPVVRTSPFAAGVGVEVDFVRTKGAGLRQECDTATMAATAAATDNTVIKIFTQLYGRSPCTSPVPALTTT